MTLAEMSRCGVGAVLPAPTLENRLAVTLTGVVLAAFFRRTAARAATTAIARTFGTSRSAASTRRPASATCTTRTAASRRLRSVSF